MTTASIRLVCLALILTLLCVPVSAIENPEDMDTFGYTQMQNDEEKFFYADLYNAVCNLERSVILPENNSFTFDRLQEISFLIADDLPEAFYYRGSLELVQNSSGTFIQVNPIYAIDDTLVYTDTNNPENAVNFAKIMERKAVVEKKLNEIVAAIPADCDTDTEKTKYIHDYLANTITYKGTRNDQTIYGALIQRECVCSGYAAAFAALCHRVDVKCWVVEGEGGSLAGQMAPHAWNVAWIDGNCLYTDVTWDDKATISYRYFNISGNTFNKDHSPRGDYAKFLGSCDHQSSTESTNERVTVTLDRSDATLKLLGETLVLKATLTASADTTKALEWKTSDSTVVTVSNNGTITAVGNGKATITVTHLESGASAKCSITVEIPRPHEHEIKPVTGKKATCTQSGIKDHFQCSSCGTRFYDVNGNMEVGEDRELEIDALGHVQGVWEYNSQQHWWICSVCNAIVEVSVQDHQLQNNGCNVCGYTSILPEETAPPTEATPSTEPSQTKKTATTPTDAPTSTVPSGQEQGEPGIFVLVVCAGLLVLSLGAGLLYQYWRRKN